MAMLHDRVAEASPLLSPARSSPSNTSTCYFPPPHSDEPNNPPKQTEEEYEHSLIGFYLYSIASEVWVITTGTLFLPIVLETYSRSNGKLGPDYDKLCPPSGITSSRDQIVARCAVYIVFTWVDTASFSLIVYSCSVALQALAVISIGVLADDPLLRHYFLLSFASLGSITSLAFVLLPARSNWWPLCAIFAMLANVSFGATTVCLNSYLPSLTRLSPIVSKARQEFETNLEQYRSLRQQELLRGRQERQDDSDDGQVIFSTSSSSSSSSSLLMSTAASRYNSIKSSQTSKISSRGIAFGYAAGITTLVLLLPIMNSLNQSGEEGEGSLGFDQTWPLRVAIGFSAVVWLLGSLIASRYLKPIMNESISTSHRRQRVLKGEGIVQSIKKSWRELFKTLREWEKLPNTFIFLSAWFLLSDSFATLTSTAMLFAKTTLDLPTSSLISIAILTPLSGIGGSLLFPLLQSYHYLPRSNLSILILLIVLSTSIPLYGLISLENRLEIYLLSILFGIFYASFQSFSRTSFSELIPKSQAGRWFGLYSITDKSSSFLGPLLVSIITNQTGEIRHGFYLILSFFLFSLPILFKVDMEKGIQDANEFEKELEQD